MTEENNPRELKLTDGTVLNPGVRPFPKIELETAEPELAPLPPATEPDQDGRVLISEADDDDDYDDSGSLSRLVDLEDPDVIAVLDEEDEELEQLLADEAAIDAPDDDETPEEETYDLELEAPDGEEFFIVKTMKKTGGSKTIHRVENNHVSRTFESWAFTEEDHDAGRKTSTDTIEREFKFLTPGGVDLLLDAGFSHCKVCSRRVDRDAQLDKLMPLIDKFDTLAAEMAESGIEVRLMAYDVSSGSPKRPRELWNSMDMVREQC